MPASGPIDPDRLAATEFSTAFRGYDTGEVRALLHAVGAALRESAEREHDLREQLASAEHHLRELREASAAQVEAAAEDARREGREMVAEAQRVRERMLGDLARRRRNARQQVEQLMAGRERLLEAFDAARHVIDTATQDMRGALPEARLAAEAAGRRFDQDVAGEEDEVAVAALEDEIEAARLVGLPLVAAEPESQPDAASPGPGRGEPSLLGERDVREMPPVELGADFEDVRIVPLGAPTGETEGAGEGADGDDGQVEETAHEAAAVDEVVGDEDVEHAADDGATAAGGDEVDVVVHTEAASEPVTVDDSGSAAPYGAAGPGAGDRQEALADPAAVSEAAAPDPPPVDPGHLDDLFASLRAARAEAVSDARSVLDRESGDAQAADAQAADAPDGPDADATSAEPAPEPASEPPSDDRPEPDPQQPPRKEAVAGRSRAEGDEETAAPPRVPAGDEQTPRPSVDVEATIAAAGERLASALKRVLADEQNELLDRLRHVGRGRRADEPGVLGDADGLVARFAAAAEMPLKEVAGVAMASTSPGKRARPPAVEPLATAAANELIEPLHERLTRGFGEAGTDTAEASARARATFREWKTRRIVAVAADAARGAFHAGLLAGVSPSTALVWSLDDEDAACPECADNALAGPVDRGQRFPTGHRHPPAHDGCRCTLVAGEPAP